MLDLSRWIALGASIVLILALAGVVVSSIPPHIPSQQQSDKNNQEEHREGKSDESLWNAWFPDSISFYTLFLMLFTGILALGMFYQLNLLIRSERISAEASRAARDSAETAKQSVIAVQRAFVFVTGVQPSRIVNLQDQQTVGWQFAVRWENSGSTPAINFNAHLNMSPFDGDIPAGFDFADIPPTDNVSGFVPPKGSIGMQVQQPIAIIQSVIENKRRLFLWGWAEYDDTFGNTPRHRIEYCLEIKIAGEFTTDKNTVASEMYRRHNRYYDIAR
jgi:hypothetical protein